MAKIGLCKPYCAKYAVADGVVTYSDGALIGKAVDVDISIDNVDNPFYSDNGLSETDNRFSSGKLTHTTDDLEQAANAMILGITPSTLTVGDDEVTELISDDNMAPPYLGFGTIITHQINNVAKYRGVVLPKVIYSVPSDAAKTKGDKIEWQTKQLNATIMRDDTAAHMWKREAWFDTFAGAEAYVKQLLNIT